VELTFEIKDEDGRPVRFGSVAGGGRYDGLVGRFRGDDVPEIKDLVLGAEIAGLAKDRDDYKAKQAEAQFAVPESELVVAVQRVLARRAKA
jgi:histidyl-tRNA synthetase